ncbi:hypothetical protein KAM644c_07010 [Klebsiella quasipneumoniae subsp. quasipneumoniae]|uniref:Uncharacterized protein n=1 Tax=Klebsiella quasipneumoniae subsp. quasipneumoniae TaxID=1667327 RepID=A0AAN1Y165_9ENTR|nr:hypothetical protein KAM622c_07080 [Klebsiella quasipneumoniae subsp. quasipneumoniae]BDO11635.1 hypothetical protein KAM644c_07010 [Klebsiella quasipneumoniae subsp. quasipneumoniae]BDO17613.1 hypothetical protein KAM645c_07030 [Klebsiella quasipneumoniae subsp. quasipneumoniae]GKO51105.1 hypothetical protein NUBL21974_39160 [Klebsiella quasipneumoniae]GKO72734.1 hypothetical protein NUBL21977_42820 [Klebsiella quasipneumoniae]
MDMQRRFPIVGFATEDFNRDVFLTGLGDDGVKHLVTAVEELKVLTSGHAQDAADVVGRVIAQRDQAADNEAFWMMDARNAHA